MVDSSDDDIQIVTGVANDRKAPIAIQHIDSDDDQPLEALKAELKLALHSSKPTSVTAEQSNQRLQPTHQKPVKKLVSKKAAAAAGLELEKTIFKDDDGRKRDVDEICGSKEYLQTSSPAWAHEANVDLDNWCLQPLQRRARRRPARTAQAAVDDWRSPADTARPLTEAAAQQQRQQQKGAQEPPRQQQRDLFHSNLPGEYQEAHWQGRQPPAAAAVDTAVDPEHSKPKRQRRTTRSADDDDYQPDDCSGPLFEPSAAGTSAGAGKHRAGRRTMAAGGSGGARVRMTAEEKAAKKAEERAHKEADKIAAKLAKQAEVAAVKAAKRFETFHARKLNGSFQEYECVLVMDTSTSGTSLGLAIAAELDRRKTIAWQVVDRLALSGCWPGCCCFCFKRRKLCEKDEHSLKTATSSRLQDFVHDIDPPYLQLVFQEPSTFVHELQRDRLAAVFSAVKTSHPDCTLGVIVVGLKPYVQRLDNQQMRQGGVSRLDWRRTSSLLLELHLSTPGLHLRLLGKQEEVATHLINTARVISHQPYSVEHQLEACGGAGPGAASKAAAAVMVDGLGPATRNFAVSTLGKMHGMGGNKAWAVAKAYPSFGALIAGFQQAANTPGHVAPALLLADLLEPAGGKAKPRRVGPTMSKRLHLLLTCEDPDVVVEGEGAAE